MGIISLAFAVFTPVKIKKDDNSSSVAISLICAFEGVRSIRKVYDDDIIFNEFLESMGNFIENLGI